MCYKLSVQFFTYNISLNLHNTIKWHDYCYVYKQNFDLDSLRKKMHYVNATDKGENVTDVEEYVTDVEEYVTDEEEENSDYKVDEEDYRKEETEHRN